MRPGKVNLNYTTASNFQNLPQMTVNTAAAMFDWQSTNTTPSTGGAKSETYSTLQTPYDCKNAPYETVDELRLVYGMNLDLLYGEDANLNGALDPNENDGLKLPPYDNQDGILDPGVFEYVTTWSHETRRRHQRHDASSSPIRHALQSLIQSNFPNLATYLSPFYEPQQQPGVEVAVAGLLDRAGRAGGVMRRCRQRTHECDGFLRSQRDE